MGAPERKTCPRCQGSVEISSHFCGSCGHEIRDDDDTGREVAGRYKILSKLGEGGMGAVHVAEQISLKRRVALKVLKPELSDTPDLVRRFNAEAELAAKLNHPNTVTLFDFGQDEDGSLFIAMELVEGRSLRELLARDGALPIDLSLYIGEQVCASLADAHDSGIVHRDLKPDNVMLTRRGKQDHIVRVLDFGIAKLRDDGRVTKNPMTRAGDLLGTPQYMAPEQIQAGKVDGRTDVYAMGCMLYEMLTGRLPFLGPTVMAVLSKHLTDTPIPPSVLRSDGAIPAPLENLVLRCLEKDMDRRPPSMEALGAEITGLRRQLGVPTPHAIHSMVPAPSSGPGRAGSSGDAVAETAYATPASQPSSQNVQGPVAAASPTPAPLATPAPASSGASTHAPMAVQASSALSAAAPGQPAPAHQHVGVGSTGAAPAMGTPVAHDFVAAAGPPLQQSLAGAAEEPRSRTWLWLVLVLLALVGGGVALALTLRGDGGDTVPADFETVPERDILDVSEQPEDPPEPEPGGAVPADFDTRPARDIF